MSPAQRAGPAGAVQHRDRAGSGSAARIRAPGLAAFRRRLAAPHAVAVRGRPAWAARRHGDPGPLRDDRLGRHRGAVRIPVPPDGDRPRDTCRGPRRRGAGHQRAADPAGIAGLAGRALARLPGLARGVPPLAHRRRCPRHLVGRAGRVRVGGAGGYRGAGPAARPASHRPSRAVVAAPPGTCPAARMMTGSAAVPTEPGRQAGLLPRLLPGRIPAEPAGLREHLARHGAPPRCGPDPGGRRQLLAEVERSGLTGRGGAAFPAARKLAAVAAAGHTPVVIANGSEGEPASAKDKVLLAREPHLVLDGAVAAAEIVGAREAVVVVHPAVLAKVAHAAAERRRSRLDRARLRVMAAADGFVAGEATAVVRWVQRGIPTPTPTPPRVSERGLRGHPTLVQNVETLAHLALIARYGAAWFRQIGTNAEPGTMLVTVTGAVRHP